MAESWPLCQTKPPNYQTFTYRQRADDSIRTFTEGRALIADMIMVRSEVNLGRGAARLCHFCTCGGSGALLVEKSEIGSKSIHNFVVFDSATQGVIPFHHLNTIIV